MLPDWIARRPRRAWGAGEEEEDRSPDEERAESNHDADEIPTRSDVASARRQATEVTELRKRLAKSERRIEFLERKFLESDKMLKRLAGSEGENSHHARNAPIASPRASNNTPSAANADTLSNDPPEDDFVVLTGGSAEPSPSAAGSNSKHISFEKPFATPFATPFPPGSDASPERPTTPAFEEDAMGGPNDGASMKSDGSVERDLHLAEAKRHDPLQQDWERQPGRRATRTLK